MSIDEFNALSKETGLKLIAIGADFAELEKDPQAVANRAKAFGANYVVCYWIPHHGDNFTLAETETAIRVFNTAGKILAENFNDILGKTAMRDIKNDEQLDWTDFE